MTVMVGAFRLVSAMLGLLAWGCAPTAIPAPGGSPEAKTPLRFQFIYMIHGDAGYTFHDRNGVRHSADADAVEQAVLVARSSPAAEVYIFHQKPVKALGVVRRSDATMLFYRGGALIERRGYRREAEDVEFKAEAALYHALSAAPDAGIVRTFAWFGHEIPVTSDLPYSRSRPDKGFTIAAFAKGLERFGGSTGPGGKPFAIILLSSCHGGTPEATSAILPYAAYLVAAPGEVHLSYLDARALSRMAETPAASFWLAQSEDWARTIAAESFARLQKVTSTDIRLSLYESPKASAWLEAHREAWVRDPRDDGEAPENRAAMEARDCALVPGFGPGGAEAGVTVFQQAPKFGPDKSRSIGSGWECRVPIGSPVQFTEPAPTIEPAGAPAVQNPPLKSAPVAASDPY
ncbi:MAG: hypothetical protein ABIW76_04065 [Fibrobacteria bacterium]